MARRRRRIARDPGRTHLRSTILATSSRRCTPGRNLSVRRTVRTDSDRHSVLGRRWGSYPSIWAYQERPSLLRLPSLPRPWRSNYDPWPQRLWSSAVNEVMGGTFQLGWLPRCGRDLPQRLRRTRLRQCERVRCYYRGRLKQLIRPQPACLGREPSHERVILVRNSQLPRAWRKP
jgi:hypothetical protein